MLLIQTTVALKLLTGKTLAGGFGCSIFFVNRFKLERGDLMVLEHQPWTIILSNWETIFFLKILVTFIILFVPF